jgi:hypothetical protein
MKYRCIHYVVSKNTLKTLGITTPTPKAFARPTARGRITLDDGAEAPRGQVQLSTQPTISFIARGGRGGNPPPPAAAASLALSLGGRSTLDDGAEAGDDGVELRLEVPLLVHNELAVRLPWRSYIHTSIYIYI